MGKCNNELYLRFKEAHEKKEKEASENKRMEIVKPKRIKNGGKHVV